MTRAFLASVFVVGLSAGASAQDQMKVEVVQQAPPSSVAAVIREGIHSQKAYRILDEQGEELAKVWLRKGTPAAEKPAGPRGVIQFPFLGDGELLGVLEFAKEGHDYRDQSVAKGVYTMRYGLQPVNGDHLGVSDFRDYVLLLPASKDQAVAAPTRKQLEQRSAESAGTSHPASFLLLMAPAGSKPDPTMIRDNTKETWSVVLPLRLQVKGGSEPLTYPVRLVVVGMAAA